MVLLNAKYIMGENLEKQNNTNPQSVSDGGNLISLKGMFQNWYLDYASYVILDRAVPALSDGLKPVQRRILHSMKELDDGRYNKVANIVGNTMKYHPHGDASIGDALVTLGQKDLLIDCQGNWGNILTGDGAAAPRYIEARLSKFALDVVYNPKITDWKPSYDGRNKEPISLPIKFPLLLAQGTEGIGVAFATKILPHNFIELIDATIAYYKGEDFTLYPDFPTGGMIDVSKYNDGLRRIKGVSDSNDDDFDALDVDDFDDFDGEDGETPKKKAKKSDKDSANLSKVRIRAKIQQIDKKTLMISEIPFGTTTDSLIKSIIEANDSGKIKIRKVDDNTAANVEIMIYLAPNVSPDQMIDALYKFTKCEISLSPNSFVINDDRPVFMSVSEILKSSAEHTKALLLKELEIQLAELQEKWQWVSLERIFIENEIYEDIKKCTTDEAINTTIDEGLKPFVKNLLRPVTEDDILRLRKIPIERISKYNSDKADDILKAVEDDMAQVQYDIEHIIDYSIAYFERIKTKYGKGRERKTEIRNFENIEAVTVAITNEKLYVNKKDGFAGYGLKKDENVEYVCDCSDLDEIIVFRKDGTYMISKVQEKGFVGNKDCKEIIYINVFRKRDERTIYNVVYSDGAFGNAMVKRFSVTGVTRDREYDLTKGTKGSKVLYFSANPNGEAETIMVHHRAKPKLRKLSFEFDFADVVIKGRSSFGNILTKNAIRKINIKGEGVSTLGARSIWFDETVKRLNVEGRGTFLGDFKGADKILSITKSGFFRTCNFDLTNHFDDDLIHIRKNNPKTILTALYQEGETKYYYLKRFQVEELDKKLSFLDEDSDDVLLDIVFDTFPRLEINYDTENSNKKIASEIIEVTDFIGVKGYKAKGKRISTAVIKNYEWLDPLPEPEPEIVEESETIDADKDVYTDSAADSEVVQGTLFD
ncbi:MAG: DNA gyrase/topoisomerase IV subunit A [Bacteroidales bacterium]|nr:DNA gyrase/topoisomerase IV subunit A [Bacteroidales bacterium]